MAPTSSGGAIEVGIFKGLRHMVVARQIVAATLDIALGTAKLISPKRNAVRISEVKFRKVAVQMLL
jgi:hypothetical protein